MALTDKLKRGWMAFAHRLGQIQTAIILFLVYVLLIGPLAILLRLSGRGDLLEMRRRRATSFAHQKEQIPGDAERCERQF
jgi:hypothetical protein